jgi:putative transcriptional regulator
MGKKLMCDLYYRMALKGIKSLAELERISGVNRITLTKLFNNESHRLDYSTVVDLCEALGCGIEELFVIVNEEIYEEQDEAIKVHRERIRRGYVYFIKDETINLIKIGRSMNVESRIYQLEREFKTKFKLLLTIPTDNTVLLEKEMHDRFKRYRFEGEWFKITEKDLEPLIKEIEKV